MTALLSPMLAAPPGTGWQTHTGRVGPGRATIAVVAGLAVGFIVISVFAWAAFALYFCLDLNLGEDEGDRVDDCADENAASERLMLIGVVTAILATAATIWGLLRLFIRSQRRNARPSVPPPTALGRAPSMQPARPPR